VLLSTAFCPPVEYFAVLAGYSSVCLEACENYAKQSWRNRCRILSANGPLDLSFPIIHDGARLITEVRVEYDTPWVRKMEKAVDSAYESSPFFEYYRDGFYAILDSKPEKLWELNLLIINWLCGRIGINPEIRFTEEYRNAGGLGSPGSLSQNIPLPGLSLPSGRIAGPSGRIAGPSGKTTAPSGIDLREAIHPKRQNTILCEMGLERPYWQVFGEKFGFVPGLSVLDLLFNEGPESICWLK